MVHSGMIEGAASGSVEQAFNYARSKLAKDGARSLPVMSDGIPGNVTLGN
jgi:hypothetical protein